jgi:hypothetical protein
MASNKKMPQRADLESTSSELDSTSELKTIKIKDKVNVKLGLLSCYNVLAWWREVAQSKARESEKAEKERKCKEREREKGKRE